MQLSIVLAAARVGVAPQNSCAGLASTALGDGVSVLSAAIVHATPPGAAGERKKTGTCTYVADSDIGDSSSVLANYPGLVDTAACCAKCYANPRCGAAAVLPMSWSNGGCWLKTGAGPVATKKGVTLCRTSRPPAPTVEYCLVKVLVQPAINIWVGLPSDGGFNGRFMALGGGGFVGSVAEPLAAVNSGYAGATTDTGHKGSSGSFGMLKPGVPDVGLRTDFGWRSEHMMAVVSKLLIAAYYPPASLAFSYWNGCSTGGRQAQAMAQRWPDDYDGVLAGAPAIHFEKLGLGQTWPQVAMRSANGGAVVGKLKQELATAAAVAACDALDGVVDGVLRDPRACNYSATALVCAPGKTLDCLSAAEAGAIDLIWRGSQNTDGTLSWYGMTRGTNLASLAGETLMSIPEGQAKYWVELDPAWDFTTLTAGNYAAFFDKTVLAMEPGPTATDNAESISAFKARGSKLLMWHGWSDNIIMPQGTIDYYNAVVRTVDGGNVSETQDWMRLFMVPGVTHCGMDAGVFFDALVEWVEHGVAPATVLHAVSSKTTRPLCPHPAVAVYNGSGSTDDAANFGCAASPVVDTEDCNTRVNMRLFKKPFVPSKPCPGC